jgi:hypothetical protein
MYLRINDMTREAERMSLNDSIKNEVGMLEADPVPTSSVTWGSSLYNCESIFCHS